MGQLTSFGKDILLNVTDIGYSNPNTLVFYGFVYGQHATLIQHMYMLSFYFWLYVSLKQKSLHGEWAFMLMKINNLINGVHYLIIVPLYFQ